MIHRAFLRPKSQRHAAAQLRIIHLPGSCRSATYLCSCEIRARRCSLLKGQARSSPRSNCGSISMFKPLNLFFPISNSSGHKYIIQIAPEETTSFSNTKLPQSLGKLAHRSSSPLTRTRPRASPARTPTEEAWGVREEPGAPGGTGRRLPTAQIPRSPQVWGRSRRTWTVNSCSLGVYTRIGTACGWGLEPPGDRFFGFTLAG